MSELRAAPLWQRVARRMAAWSPLSWLLAHLLHRLDRIVIQLTDGRQSLTSVMTGLPVAMVTAIGSKSGQPRTVPLLPLRDGENLVLIASNYGRAHHPAWYHNLKANPDAEVAIDGQTRRYTAREATGEERERHWRHAVEHYAGYAAYKERAADREIPIMVLEPST